MLDSEKPFVFSEQFLLKQEACDLKIISSSLDDYVVAWHVSGYALRLHEYLGMTKIEYAAWIHSPDILQEIVEKRKIEKQLNTNTTTLEEYQNRIVSKHMDEDYKRIDKRIIQYIRKLIKEK